MSEPTPNLPIEIRHNRVMAVFMLLCAAIILATTAIVGVSLNTLTGVVLLVVAAGYLTKPGVVVTERGFEFRNLLGMTMRRVEFRSLADVTVENGAFYVARSNGREKVIGMRWFLHGEDVRRLEEAVRAAAR